MEDPHPPYGITPEQIEEGRRLVDAMPDDDDDWTDTMDDTQRVEAEKDG
jgi:hypothetical protein